MKKLSIEATIQNLEVVLDFVNTKLEAVGLDVKTQSQIAVATEEIFINIARYAYNPEAGGVTISICVSDFVTIEFADNGKPYNPLDKIDPDITKSIEDREIGGLGIYMVKKIMDRVEYKHINGKNILTIKKGISENEKKYKFGTII